MCVRPKLTRCTDQCCLLTTLLPHNEIISNSQFLKEMACRLVAVFQRARPLTKENKFNENNEQKSNGVKDKSTKGGGGGGGSSKITVLSSHWFTVR